MVFHRSITLRFSILLVLLVVTIRASAGDQGPLPCGLWTTIPERLAKHGISLGSHTLIGGGYYKTRPSAATYLPDSDVIVEGTIGIGRSYLSEDQCEIYMDYEILGPIFHFPTYDSAEGSALRNALAAAPVIVRIKGGSITINGLVHVRTRIASIASNRYTGSPAAETRRRQVPHRRKLFRCVRYREGTRSLDQRQCIRL